MVTGDRPTLHQLQDLRVQHQDSPVRVIDTIAGQWETVAIALHFEWNTIEFIRYNSNVSTVSMLGRWINGGGRKPVNWDTLISSLSRAGFSTLAGDLRSACS